MSDPTEPLKALRAKLIANRVLYFAVKETQVKVADRVFGEGKLTDGTELQYDQDYEVYAYQPPSPRKVSGKGKPYAQWKNPPKNVKGKAAKIKGGYYPTYLDYKDKQGRKDNPFELTGRLQKAYVNDTALVEVARQAEGGVEQLSIAQGFIFISNCGLIKVLRRTFMEEMVDALVPWVVGDDWAVSGFAQVIRLRPQLDVGKLNQARSFEVSVVFKRRGMCLQWVGGAAGSKSDGS